MANGAISELRDRLDDEDKTAALAALREDLSEFYKGLDQKVFHVDYSLSQVFSIEERVAWVRVFMCVLNVTDGDMKRKPKKRRWDVLSRD